MMPAGVMMMALRCFRWFRRFCGLAAFRRAYDAAQLRDLEYAAAHPDCSLAEAHRERDRVLRDYGRG